MLKLPWTILKTTLLVCTNYSVTFTGKLAMIGACASHTATKIDSVDLIS